MNKTGEILFSKYKILKILKESDKTPVFLCTHIHMGSERIIKAVLKDPEGFESLQSEVIILRGLNHRGIPHIYDIEEDSAYYYIVEEYIAGKTLSDLVKEKGRITEQQAYAYMAELADIVTYLHSKRPDAVLHLDIQPKNIIIKEERLYLIDFGNAALKKDAGEKVYVKGTMGFASPEQYEQGNVDERTDIYGIGACFYYALTGIKYDVENSIITGPAEHILKGCLRRKPEERYSSTQILQRHLAAVRGTDYSAKYTKREINAENQQNSPQIISFIGSKRGIGTSTVAMEITRYLIQSGYKAIYEEDNETEMVRKIVQNAKAITYEEGCFRYEGCLMKPKYDNHKVQRFGEEKIIIRDEGVYDDEKNYGSTLVLIGGDNPWEIKETIDLQKRIVKRYYGQPHMRIVWLIQGTACKNTKIELPDYNINALRIPYIGKSMEEFCKKVVDKFR